jgi:hypothetical protein
MKFDVGTFVVLAFALIFYARFAWLRGSKARRRKALSGFGQIGNPKNPIDPQATRPLVRVYFTHTYLVLLGIVLLVGGVFLNITTDLDPALRAIWWAPMALGLFIFILVIH